MPRKKPNTDKNGGAKAAADNNARKKKRRRTFLAIYFAILALLLLAAAATLALAYYNVIEVPALTELLVYMGLREDTAAPTADDDGRYHVEAPDADAYFEANAQVLAKTPAESSAAVPTEAEACAELADRGFTDYAVTAEYAMDGSYTDAVEVSDASSAKHPYYQTFYVSAGGDLWTIFVINGAVMANPVSYNLQSSLGVQVVLSQTPAVMSYDGTTNTFFETIPDPTELIVKVVARIDAATLDSLTAEAIDAL